MNSIGRCFFFSYTAACHQLSRFEHGSQSIEGRVRCLVPLSALYNASSACTVSPQHSITRHGTMSGGTVTTDVVFTS